MDFSSKQLRLFLGALFLILVLSPSLLGSVSGNLSGIIKDQGGNPVAHLLVSVVARSANEALPILTRTDEEGQLVFRNLKAGTYELLIKSSAYVSPSDRLVEIRPGQTSVVSLVLEQLFALGTSDQDNIGIKSLLRSATDRRLIFRTVPDVAGLEQRPPFFDKAVFEVYTGSGLGSSIYPGDSYGGTSTNFAAKETLLGGSEYIVAGQINSGSDSLWRIRNVLNYKSGDRHSVQLFMGFGRVSFDQPSLSLLDNPVTIGNDPDYVKAVGTTKILSFGVKDRLQLADSLSVVLGVEMDQVRDAQSHYFVNPNAQVEFKPLSGTAFRVMTASKRPTRGDTISLPDHQTVELAEAVSFAYLGNQAAFGSSRYYQASITQKLGARSELELAAYQNQLFGPSVPFLAVFSRRPEADVVHLDDHEAQNRGYRVTVNRHFGENVTASLSYIRANAAGLTDDGAAAVDFVDEQTLKSIFHEQIHHALSAQVDAFIPVSHTRITALIKAVPDSSPVVPLDAFGDVYDASNKGVNLFIRQLIPLPNSLLGLVSLDFLAGYKLEALLDIRNLTNEDLGLLQTLQGELSLLQNPRTVRGGIALNF